MRTHLQALNKLLALNWNLLVLTSLKRLLDCLKKLRVCVEGLRELGRERGGPRLACMARGPQFLGPGEVFGYGLVSLGGCSSWYRHRVWLLGAPAAA